MPRQGSGRISTAVSEVLSSSVFNGTIQLLGVVVAVIGILLTARCSEPVAAAGREGEINRQEVLRQEHFSHLRMLHGALEKIATKPATFSDYPMETITQSGKENNASDPDSTVQAFHLVRSELLKLYGLSAAFASFYKAYSIHKEMPGDETKEAMLLALKKLASQIDVAVQRLAGMVTPARSPRVGKPLG